MSDMSQRLSSWAETAMRWLRVVTLPAEVTAAFFLGLLGGGVVLGFSPALRAAVAMSRSIGAGESGTPWRDAYQAWRTDFWASWRALWGWAFASALLVVDFVIVVLTGVGWLAMVPLFLIGALVIRSAVLRVVLMDPPADSIDASATPGRAAIVISAVRVGSTITWLTVALLVTVVTLRFPPVGIAFGPGLLLVCATWLAIRDLRGLRA